LLYLSVWIFGIAETGIARGSPPGTTAEVLRFGIPFAEIRVVSAQLQTCKARKLRAYHAKRYLKGQEIIQMGSCYITTCRYHL
jgi:hypothetical protein